MKSLVVYYSVTGKTRLVAQAIGNELNATVMEISETKPRKRGPSLYAIGGFEAKMNKRSKIEPIEADLAQYERVFVGSPVWNSRPVPAINAYLDKCSSLRGKEAICFVTYGSGAGKQRTLKAMKKRLEAKGARVIGTISFQQREGNERCKEKLKELL